MSLGSLVPSMRQMGVRCLLIISGEKTWCLARAQQCVAMLGGDIVWVGPKAPQGVIRLSIEQAQKILGQELSHVVFDASDAFNVEAIAAISGALCAGHWLILLVPSWSYWPQQQDADSLRWTESDEAITTPHFIRHCQQVSERGRVTLWRQGEALHVVPLPSCPVWQPPSGIPTDEQQRILQQLLTQPCAVNVVIGARGRGKSTLAAQLAAKVRGSCWVTAPSKHAATILGHKMGLPFFAPDALLVHCKKRGKGSASWLLVDEAAAIPTPLLMALIRYFPRVLLTTTVQGYEGTGKGFLLKFCAALPDYQLHILTAPIRWSVWDPLEQWLNHLLMFEEPHEPQRQEGILQQRHLTQGSGVYLLQCYQLLSSAHYRTTPQDLRRLMDAPGQHFSATFCGQHLVAALWMVDEGGLAVELVQQVWAGTRRPKGNLVAQSLVAHGGQCLAALLPSRRLSRIAVFPHWRRQGIARDLVAAAQQQAQKEGIAYLSVSFGYTPELYRFWCNCGFKLVRLGTHLEASSGCYNAMAMLPLIPESTQLCARLQLRLQRNSHFMQQQHLWAFPLTPLPDFRVNEDDRRELYGFAFASRPFYISLYALIRYAQSLPDPLMMAILTAVLQGESLSLLAKKHGFKGKRIFISYLRGKIAQHLSSAIS